MASTKTRTARNICVAEETPSHDICFVNVENIRTCKNARNSAYHQRVTVVFDIHGPEPAVVRKKLEDIIGSWPGAAAAAASGGASPTSSAVCASSQSSPQSQSSALPSPPSPAPWKLDTSNLEDALASLDPDRFEWS